MCSVISFFQEKVDMMIGLTDGQAGKIAEHLKLDKDGPSYESVSQSVS